MVNWYKICSAQIFGIWQKSYRAYSLLKNEREKSIRSANRSCCWWPPVDGNTTVWLLWRKGKGFLFCFCGEWADHRAWSSVSLSCIWSRWAVHWGAASQRWGWDWRRGMARQVQAGDTSNEGSVKLVANNGCPRNRRNGAIVFPKCLFSITWDVWKGYYPSFKKKKEFFFLLFFFFILSLVGGLGLDSVGSCPAFVLT